MKEIKFIKSVYNLKDLPEENLPEIALCGRSNVGKSSFLNSIFNRKKLAKTSSSPGKTRSINYYLLKNKLYIVDLPGFGYAKVSKKERNSWQKMVENYFSLSRNINSAFHFIDCRYKPTNLDLVLNEFLKFYNIPFTVILNKIDKLNQSEIAKSIKSANEIFPELIFGKNLLHYSSVKGTGRKKILTRITKLME